MGKIGNWLMRDIVIFVGVLIGALALIVISLINCESRRVTYTYAQDEKTGLCFAHSNTDGFFGGENLANVPCTEAVLKEISTAKE